MEGGRRLGRRKIELNCCETKQDLGIYKARLSLWLSLLKASTRMSSLAVPSTKSMNRRNSLRLPPQPPPAPVPPSLIKSPYLNAPVFSSNPTSPRFPSEQDERWLQDTVPISTSKSIDSAAGAADRRGSVVHPPSRRPQGLGITLSNGNGNNHSSFSAYPRTPGARTPIIEGLPSSSYFSPTLSAATGRSRGSSNSSHLAAHSLAPPPDPYLISGGTGYAGRPVKLNQAHSTPTISRLGGNSADQAYLTTNSSQSSSRGKAS